MKIREGINFEYSNNLTLIYKGDDVFEIFDPNMHYYNQIKDLKNLNDLEFKNFLITNNIVSKKEKFNLNSEVYINNYYFIEAITNYNSSVNKIINNLGNLKIGIIGLGGIGSIIFDNLKRIGFKNFYLIDFDIVEESNLNRQYVYNKNDLNSLKTDCIKAKEDYNITIKTFNRKISCAEDIPEEFSKLNLIVNAADTPKNINNILGNFSRTNNIPFIYGTVGIISGTWGPFFDKNNPYIPNFENYYSTKASICSTNSIVATFISWDIFNYFTKTNKNYPLYKTKYINFNNLTIEVF